MPDQFEWMTLLQIPFILGAVWALSRPLSLYMATVAMRQTTPLDRFLTPLEERIYQWTGIKPEQEQRWQYYALDAVYLNAMGVVFLIFLQMTQHIVFSKAGVDFIQALNTAISFATNTNWQSYIPETTLDNRVQTIGLTVQMFLSAGTGMAVALALTRAFINNNRDIKTIGNFWVDCTRMILWVLLPLSFVLALIFIGFGIPQSLYEAVASQESIKLLGTNGGGFFNANSAHPFENPSAFCNLLEIGAMLLIVISFPKTFGHMVGNPSQGKALFKAMTILFLTALGLALFAQWSATHDLGSILEGMELRFGWVGTVLFNVAATTTGTGAGNAALSSLPPLVGLEFLANILTGGVIFGGVGSGFCQLVLYAVLSIFLAGLMVGRTPEYLGKKIEAFEMKMVVLALMIPPFCVLALSALGVIYAPLAPLNPGPHGLTEILYAFASTTNNNGSAFAGLKADMTFYQLTTAFAMVVGRYAVMIAVLAMAGSLATKPKIPATAATFPTTGGLFVGLLVAVILITSGLIFFPVCSLGPIAEQVSQWPIPSSL
jgi:K+-transporting ATPase ATPase A chain